MRAAIFVVAAALGVTTLAGCHNSRSAPVVSIQSVQPSSESPLLEGDRVIFEATVRAQGLDKPATVGMLVQSDGDLLGSSELAPIEDGQTATLRVAIAVPDVASIQVITPLYVGKAERTKIVAMRNYKVLGRRG